MTCYGTWNLSIYIFTVRVKNIFSFCSLCGVLKTDKSIRRNLNVDNCTDFVEYWKHYLSVINRNT